MVERTLPVTRLAVRSVRRRILLLLAFAAIFLAAAFTARAVSGHGDHLEPDALYQVGGYPLVSAILLLGWTIGRFPVLAILVLGAGLFSADHASGQARLLAVRPPTLGRVYGLRLLALAVVAFVISAVLMPAFDLLLLGQWAGPATLVLIAAYIIAYGGLLALLSVFTRADAWIAVGLGILALVWSTLGKGGLLTGVPTPLRDAIRILLPPQDAFFALENAFAGMAPIPWTAFLTCVAYGALGLFLAAALITRREI